MAWFFALLTLAAGCTSTLQSASNQMLQKNLAAPFWTVAIIAFITCIISLAIPLAMGERFPSFVRMSQAPWWTWLGGAFGVMFVVATVLAPPRLGAGVFVALLVTSSTIASVLLDHFGWLGFEIRPATWGRIMGALLMIAGVALVSIF